MIDHTVHVADLLRVLLGEDPVRVQAQTGSNMYGKDWEDTAMPEKPTRETAEKIQKKIRDNDWFLFLATPNSTSYHSLQAADRPAKVTMHLPQQKVDRCRRGEIQDPICH